MKALVVIVAALGLGACKGKADCPKAEPVVAKPAPVPAPARSDSDPDFVRVDRDQLAALCVATHLPMSTMPADFGALSVGDKRLPWLMIWMDEDLAKLEHHPYVAEKEWVTGAKDYIALRLQLADDTDPNTKIEWANIPCDSTEATKTVISAVFFEKKEFHAVAIRGTKVLDETMPASTPRNAVFKRAFELTGQLFGHSVTVATHKLGGGSPLSTVTAGAWAKASGAKAP